MTGCRQVFIIERPSAADLRNNITSHHSIIYNTKKPLAGIMKYKQLQDATHTCSFTTHKLVLAHITKPNSHPSTKDSFDST